MPTKSAAINAPQRMAQDVTAHVEEKIMGSELAVIDHD
jgi:hypothetical protein